MTEIDKLYLLKADLQNPPAQDSFLLHLLTYSRKLIEREGIKWVPNDIEFDTVNIQYAAYLFRKRGAPETAMPRFLRYALNNILFSQKGAGK